MPSPAGSLSATCHDDYSAFYGEHAPRLRRYCAMRFGRSQADEISQLTMERALQCFDTLDRVRDPWPWLRVVARNIGLNLQRHEDRCSPVDDMAALVGQADRWSDPVDAAERAEKRVLMHTALARLSDGQQRVLVLRLQEELPLESIAELLGTTENAVRQQLFKARRSFVRAYAALSGSGLVLAGCAGLGRAVRGLLRPRQARQHVTAAAGLSMVLSAASLGLVMQLPSGPAAGGTTAPRVDVGRMASYTAAVATAHRRVAPAVSTAPSRHGTAGSPGPDLRATVSRHPLAPGEAASVSVTVVTPVGTVYFHDKAVNGEAGPVCSAQPTACS